MKRLLALLTAAIFAVIIPAHVLAVATPTSGVDCSGAENSAFCQDTKQKDNPLFGADGILTKAASILTIVTGVISMFVMTIAGLRFITSSGDPTKVESARSAILYSAIGLLVAISGQAIVSLVLNNL